MAELPASEQPRTIVLVRHAKSSRGVDVDDHERQLSGRGHRDAQAVGHLLAEKGIVPDLVLCSTAVRARQTWAGAEKGGAFAAEVKYAPQIYQASAEDLVRLLRRTPATVACVLMVGHVPGVPDLASYLGRRTVSEGRERLEEKFSTSAVAVLAYEGPWSNLGPQRAELVTFDVPRGAPSPAD